MPPSLNAGWVHWVLKTYRTVVEISSAFRRNPDCKVHRLEGGVGVGIPDPAEARFGIHEDMLKDSHEVLNQ